MELKDKPEPYIATSVGNAVRDMGKRLMTQCKRNVRLEDIEKD